MCALIKTNTQETLIEAAQILHEGGLVAIPTETVYGLAANARDSKAVEKIYKAKGRPNFNPLITHISTLYEAEELGIFNDTAQRLAQYFWPGPLTMIVPSKDNSGISKLVTAGLETIALRIPAHKTTLSLLKSAQLPLAAPSANISGSLSPTSPIHVAESLGTKIDLILAAGSCGIGLESTVIDVTSAIPKILRPGAITAADISAALECDIDEFSADSTQIEPNAPKSPGLLLKHYAPNTPIRLNAVDLEPNEALLAFGSIKFMGIKGSGSASNLPDTHIQNLSENSDLHEAASNLFSMLHTLDQSGANNIAVMQVPNIGIGIAINDRLKRAAEK